MPTQTKLKAQILRAKKLLYTSIEGGISKVHDNGYQWVCKHYLPSIGIVESNVRSNKDHLLLSDAYYILGDIHDFNKSPLAAIEAYKRSIAFEPSHSESWRELAGMHHNIGENQLAREAIAESIRLDNSDKFARYDYENIQEASSDPYDKQLALFQLGDVLWTCQEFLSNGHVHLALELLEGRRSIEARLVRLRAFGMLNDIGKIKKEWAEIQSSKGRISIVSADWYYMPMEIYNSVTVWKIIKKMGPKWIEDYAPHKSLLKIIPIWDETAKSMLAIEKQQTKCRELTVEYHIARTGGDLQKISKLCKQYPIWIEARRLEKLLKKKAIGNGKEKVASCS